MEMERPPNKSPIVADIARNLRSLLSSPWVDTQVVSLDALRCAYKKTYGDLDMHCGSAGVTLATILCTEFAGELVLNRNFTDVSLSPAFRRLPEQQQQQILPAYGFGYESQIPPWMPYAAPYPPYPFSQMGRLCGGTMHPMLHPLVQYSHPGNCALSAGPPGFSASPARPPFSAGPSTAFAAPAWFQPRTPVELSVPPPPSQPFDHVERVKERIRLAVIQALQKHKKNTTTVQQLAVEVSAAVRFDVDAGILASFLTSDMIDCVDCVDGHARFRALPIVEVCESTSREENGVKGVKEKKASREDESRQMRSAERPPKHPEESGERPTNEFEKENDIDNRVSLQVESVVNGKNAEAVGSTSDVRDAAGSPSTQSSSLQQDCADPKPAVRAMSKEDEATWLEWKSGRVTEVKYLQRLLKLLRHIDRKVGPCFKAEELDYMKVWPALSNVGIFDMGDLVLCNYVLRDLPSHPSHFIVHHRVREIEFLEFDGFEAYLFDYLFDHGPTRLCDFIAHLESDDNKKAPRGPSLWRLLGDENLRRTFILEELPLEDSNGYEPWIRLNRALDLRMVVW